MAKNVTLDEKLLEKILIKNLNNRDDPAHDISHIKRVVKNAKMIAAREGGDLSVILPAAWLHDIVNLPKNHPKRSESSSLAANLVGKILKQYTINETLLSKIQIAIVSHSFSTNIKAKTLEAKIVQDADRLDSLGAIGLARVFVTAGILKTSILSPIDPFSEKRVPDDNKFALDHFKIKLFKIADTLNTNTAKEMAITRLHIMNQFIKALKNEIL